MSDSDRETPCAAVRVPASMAATVAGYAWARDQVGEAGASVYRLHGKPGAPDLYLKHGCGTVADDVRDEAARLRWLAGHVPAPAVIGFAEDADGTWLLMGAVSGRTAFQWLEADPDDVVVVDAVAGFLRRLHAIPTADCPFDSSFALRLDQARKRMVAGLVDADDFDDERTGWTAEQVWDAMAELLPLSPDAVVTHGDFSLDNILLRDGEVVGVIDVGRAGVADRYQDLAILWNGLGDFGPTLQRRMFESYGIAQPDERKLHVHLMLDEFF